MIKNALVILVTLLGLAARAFPETNKLPAVLTLQELVDTALADNSGLRAVRAKWEAMQERPAQARALSNPMFTYRGMDAVSGGSFPNTGEKRFELEQAIPFPGKRGLRKEAAALEADIARYDYEAAALDIVMQVRETAFELNGIRRVIQLTRDEENVVRGMIRVAETRYAAGQAEQQDVLTGQTELSMLQARRLDLEAKEKSLAARLNALLNRPAGSAIELDAMTAPDLPAPALDQLLAAAEQDRPELKSAMTDTRKSETEKRQARREFLPDYKLGAEYREVAEGENMAMFAIGVDLPLWQGSYRAGVRSAEKQIASSRENLEAVHQQVSLDVQDSLANYTAARDKLNLYQGTLLPQAEARFGASQASYQTGKADFQAFLDSERFLLNARLMTAMAESELGATWARLERAAGRGAESEGET
jgi:outer membrane protein TolC